MKKPALAALLALVTVSSALAQPLLKPYQLPGGDPYPSTYHAVPSAPVIIRVAATRSAGSRPSMTSGTHSLIFCLSSEYCMP